MIQWDLTKVFPRWLWSAPIGAKYQMKYENCFRQKKISHFTQNLMLILNESLSPKQNN